MSDIGNDELCLLSKGSQVRVLSGAPKAPLESINADQAEPPQHQANTPQTEEKLRNALSARIEELKAELAQAKLQYETEAKWRKAYQEAKGKMYEAGGELATWAVDNMPCNESQVDAWFRKQYVYREAYEHLQAQLASAQQQAAREARLAERMREALTVIAEGCARQLAEPRDAANDQACIVRCATDAEAAITISPTAALAEYRDRVLEEVAKHFDLGDLVAPRCTFKEIATAIRAMKGTK